MGPPAGANSTGVCDSGLVQGNPAVGRDSSPLASRSRPHPPISAP